MLLQFKGDSLTSSEPSRQLSCPSQRRLADTQPPLVHTYSLTEQDGTTAEEKSVTGGFVRLWLVGDSSDLTECTLSYSQWTKRKCFFDLQKNNNYKLNSSHLQYKQCCGQQRLHKGGRLCGSVCGGSFLHLFPGRFFHLHPSCNLPARHTATSSRCTGCCDSETGRLSSVPHSLSAIKHSEKHQGHVQRPAAGLFPAQPPAGRKQKTTSYIVKQLTQRSLTQSVTMKERSEGLTNGHMNTTVVLTQADLHCWNRAAPPPPRARCGSGGEARLQSVSVSTEWGLHVWFQRRAV